MLYSRAIAFGRYPFPSVSYVLEMEETDIFGYSQRKLFPPTDSHRRSRNLAPFLSFSGLLLPRITEEFASLFPFWQLCIWKRKKSQFRVAFLKKSSKYSEALCNLRNPFPSVSYVAKNSDFPNFAQVFVKKAKKSPQPRNPRWGVVLCLLFTFYHGMRNCRPSSSAGFFWMPCNHPR